MVIGDFSGIKRSIFLLAMLFSPTCVFAVTNDGFHQTGPHQAVAMRRLMAPHSYGVLVVAEGTDPVLPRWHPKPRKQTAWPVMPSG